MYTTARWFIRETKTSKEFLHFRSFFPLSTTLFFFFFFWVDEYATYVNVWHSSFNRNYVRTNFKHVRRFVRLTVSFEWEMRIQLCGQLQAVAAVLSFTIPFFENVLIISCTRQWEIISKQEFPICCTAWTFG